MADQLQTYESLDSHSSTKYLLSVPYMPGMGFPSGTVVKNLPVVQETGIGSLGQKDPLEKGMDTHSSMLAWRVPWTEEPGGLQSMGLQRIGHD